MGDRLCARGSLWPEAGALGAIYGGYFGGGIGFLMLSALMVAGLPVRSAEATKSALAAVMNASAVAMFVLSPEYWLEVLFLGAGSILGGLAAPGRFGGRRSCY